MLFRSGDPCLDKAAALSWRVTRAAAPAPSLPGWGGLPQGIPVRALQPRVWAVWPALQPGYDVAPRWPLPDLLRLGRPGTPGAGLPGGLRQDARPRVHLTWQAALARPGVQNGQPQSRHRRVALALLAQDADADLRRGVLIKIELYGQTTLAWRPRGGRLGVLLARHRPHA